MSYRWVDCDRATVSRRYDRLAPFIPLFDRLFFVPRGLRRQAVDCLELRRGDSVLEIGCGTGNSLRALRDAVGPQGRVYGVDISPGMLSKAKARCAAAHWRNIALRECDAADYQAPTPLDGVLFTFSFNTMPHYRAVLRNAWDQLRPGGRVVIVDAKLPSGAAAKLLLPFSLWLMRHTMLGNPLIHPWSELAAVAEHVDMRECGFDSYYICRAVKPLHSAAPVDTAVPANDDAAESDPAYRIAAQ